MFKSARWRNEKNKIKVIFKLQFHATHVPQVLGNVLIVSLIPADVGKPTIKLEKAAVRDGSCYWGNPVFETMKLVQEPRTGKINEKIYHFQVSNGSSKGSIIGDVSMDFSDYINTIKPSSISLPLKNSKSGAVLHVLIQRMQENVDRMEVEGIEKVELNPEEKSLKNNSSNDINGTIHRNFLEDAPCNNFIPSNGELNGNHRAFSGSTDTMSSSESSSGFDTPRELTMKNNENHDPISSPSSINHSLISNKTTDDPSSIIYEVHGQSQCDWSMHSDHGLSKGDSTNDIAIEQLKSDLLVFARQAEMSELELQTLRKQIVKECKKGQDLLREVINLREERDGLKVKNKIGFEGGDLQALVEELRQELNHEKDLNANLRLQLQKTQEANSELILAVQDLEEMLKNKKNEDVPDIESDVEEQKELEDIVKEHNDAKEIYLLQQKLIDLNSEVQIYRRDRDELEMQMEQLALDYEILKQENHDLSYKLNQSQVQEQLKIQYECADSFALMNDLESQIENLEGELKTQAIELSDSLATVDELKIQVEILQKELEKQTLLSSATIGEHKIYVESLQKELEQQTQLSSATIDELKIHIESLQKELEKQTQLSSATIDELETHVKSLEEELEIQTESFETDLDDLIQAKVEQEKRAIRAEEALRTTRWKNANTAERLQDDFKVLSMQMASTFSANEILALKALKEAHELRLQKNYLEKMLQKTDDELHSLKEEYKANVYENALNLEQMKTLLEETELLLQRSNLEKTQMQETIAVVRNEVNRSVQELNIMSCLKDEKDKEVENLQLQLNTLMTHYNGCMAEQDSDAVKFSGIETRIQIPTKSNNEIAKNEVKAATFDHTNEGRLGEMLMETTLLKKRNVTMEGELKEMQERYSEISLKFAEVEGERQRLLMKVRSLKNHKKS